MEGTNIRSSDAATLTISVVTEEGFDYNLFAMCGGNIGEIDDHAYFVREDCAVIYVGDDERLQDLKIQPLGFMLFMIEDDSVKVYACNGGLPLGAGGSAGGEYINGNRYIRIKML